MPLGQSPGGVDISIGPDSIDRALCIIDGFARRRAARHADKPFMGRLSVGQAGKEVHRRDAVPVGRKGWIGYWLDRTSRGLEEYLDNAVAALATGAVAA